MTMLDQSYAPHGSPAESLPEQTRRLVSDAYALVHASAEAIERTQEKINRTKAVVANT